MADIGAINIEPLYRRVRERVDTLGLRPAARQANINASTLGRMYDGRQPSLLTFRSAVQWLRFTREEVNSMLGIRGTYCPNCDQWIPGS